MADEENEITYTDPILKYDTIGNLEKAKHAFFNNELDEFVKEMTSKEYKYCKAVYKYNEDYSGRPDFVVRNLNRGFIQNLDDVRKYFLTCFRCNEVDTKVYSFESYWVINTQDPAKVLESVYEDFTWTNITFEEFYEKFKRVGENCITEDYLH